MRCSHFVLCLGLAFCLRVAGQGNMQARVQQALLMEQQGDFERALKLFQSLVHAKELDAVETGRIWTQIGYAQQEEGDFASARASYERAVRTFLGDPLEAADEAAALDNLANLCRATGQLKTARGLEQKSLHLFERAGDHGGAAWALTHLAVIELTRKNQREAERDLNGADEEAQRAPDLGKDYQVSLYSTKGWLAELEGDSTTAIFDYDQALAIEPHKDSVVEGWQYALLGRAYANDGQLTNGLDDMRKGLAILSDTVGTHSPKYLAVEIAYAQILDSSGEHAESVALRNSVERELGALCPSECRSFRQGILAGR